jgi:hypothetical protein
MGTPNPGGSPPPTPAEIVAEAARTHRAIGVWGRCWKCGRTNQSYTEHIAGAVLDALAADGLVVVPAAVVAGTIKSFRDVEELQLYDAATHRWIDLLAEVSSRPTTKEQQP